jgi:hypothetical protein
VEAGLRLVVRRAVRDYLERAARVVRVQEGGVAVRIRFRCRFPILRIMGVSRFRSDFFHLNLVIEFAGWCSFVSSYV